MRDWKFSQRYLWLFGILGYDALSLEESSPMFRINAVTSKRCEPVNDTASYSRRPETSDWKTSLPKITNEYFLLRMLHNRHTTHR
jgi:hypothetical protein